MDPFELHRGNCIEVMRTLEDASVDAIVTDPPYELTSARPGGRSPATEGKVMKGFMGMAWDGSGIAYSVEMWTEALRVLKPGGHLLAFSGSRTYHRMVCAIEDAGFEIRDQIMWVYGSGFPKSLNLDGDWEGWGTALKPSHEPIVVARKPLSGTVTANVLAHGTGALNIDDCRIAYAGTDDAAAAAAAAAEIRGRQTERNVEGWGMRSQDIDRAEYLNGSAGLGRWPANLIHDGSDEVLALFPQSTSGAMKLGTQRAAQDGPGSICYGTYGGNTTSRDIEASSGSAARFFYCAKASSEDRHEGLPHPGAQFTKGSTLRDAERVGAGRGGNFHPTVKPTELMRYLCRLVTPRGGLVLDPFMGSGSTGKAAVLEGFRFIGIELDEGADGEPLGYLDIARARIEFAARMGHQPSLLEAAA